MRTLLAVGVLGAAALARADEIYEWVDAAGRRHYQSAPDPGAAAARPESTPPVTGDTEPAAPADAADGAAAAPADDGAGDAAAELRHRELEREYAQASRELAEIDAQLATLAKARNTPNPAIESLDLGDLAVDPSYKSDEELRLEPERERAAKRVADIKAEHARLRQTVAQGEGGLPAWWHELR